MPRALFKGLQLFFLGFAIVSAGCASSAPSRFYQLSSIGMKGHSSTGNSGEKRTVIAVGPLRIPDYLDRQEIVTRAGSNRLRVAEFDRWAGSLETDTVRVLTEDLSSLLPEDRFLVIPWVSASEAAVPSDYHISVDIIRLDGSLGGSVSLRAQWALFESGKGLLLRRESVITEDVHGRDYGAFVRALSNAVAGLGMDMASSITSF